MAQVVIHAEAGIMIGSISCIIAKSGANMTPEETERTPIAPILTGWLANTISSVESEDELSC